jgi:hypothetical protein
VSDCALVGAQDGFEQKAGGIRNLPNAQRRDRRDPGAHAAPPFQVTPDAAR